MGNISALGQMLRGMLHIDRSQVSIARGLRNAIGVVVPLAIGIAIGQVAAGLIVSIGALNVAFLDLPGPYRLRVARMLAGGVVGAFSVFVGSSTGTLGPLTVLLAALWGFGAGLLVIFGPAITQIGMTGIILLLVYGAFPGSPAHAALLGAFVLAGSMFQMLLAVAAWPFRRFGPERDALRTVFMALAAYAGAPPEAGEPPPATAEMSAASILLGRNTHDGHYARFRALLTEAERIRLELLALAAIRPGVPAGGQTGGMGPQLDALSPIGEILMILAEAVKRGGVTPAAANAMARLQRDIAEIRDDIHGATDHRVQASGRQLLSHLEALVALLGAAMELTDGENLVNGERTVDERFISHTPENDYLDTLRANLTLRSAAFRHALRLAATLALTIALAHAFGLYRGYWAALTVAIVLKPDFGSTFTRGIGRIIGTLLGLVVATGLVYLAFGSVAARVVLVGVLTFAIRAAGAANFSLTAIAVTALVVVFISFVGARPETIILARGADTLIGGALSLVAYAVWPTWEHSQTPSALADMLDAYRRYWDTVMAIYLEPSERERPQCGAARLAARLTRSNAQDSVGRLRAEPAQLPGFSDAAEDILAESNRFINAAMVLETGPKGRMPEDTGPLRTFTRDVDATLAALSAHLRDPAQPLGMFPDLDADQRALDASKIDGAREGGGTILGETDGIVQSLTAMASTLRDGATRGQRSRSA